MLRHLLPWRFLVKRTARAYGFIDPLTILARLRRFAQPSEVQEPIELLRAGILFHARGLINTRAIQYNLDWVWPYWVEKQFNPNNPSFIPRAFSFSHINLTHRNWTAVGQPELPLYPIVDPRGLVTPLHDGWSIDFWVLSKDGKDNLLPSKIPEATQDCDVSPNLQVRTRCRAGGNDLTTSTWVDFQEDVPCLQVKAEARTGEDGWVAVAVRPYNPEGIQFIDRIEFDTHSRELRVDGTRVMLGDEPEKVAFSSYEEGDVFHKLRGPGEGSGVTCSAGMATAGALFPVSPGSPKVLSITVPLDEAFHREFRRSTPSTTKWATALDGTARLNIPDPTIQLLFDAAVRTLTLLSGREIVPGPFTYRRFWFRDACLMTHALLLLGFRKRSLRLLTDFLSRQKRSGYFQSQRGEWDSNGQVLWVLDRFHRLTGHPFDPVWIKAVLKGADWIMKKRISKKKDADHKGLLPPGFSAEHFGPNDYYYWDNFWGVGGLEGAARLVSRFHSKEKGTRLFKEAEDFKSAIFASIASIPDKRSQGAIPASPHRRMDAGAIGTLSADYPLQLLPGGDPRIMRTVEFLMNHCFQSGGFFQDMIHSGINAYLTLSIAQSLLRVGDLRYRQLIRTVADLASPTGQWPEAIHPFTGGGCMGDGQHGWAAAEWVSIVRNLFVREETGRLVLGPGVFPEWLETPGELSFGPTLTSHGPVSVRISRSDSRVLLAADIDWAFEPGPVDIQVPGYRKETIHSPQPRCYLEPERIQHP